MSLYSNMIKIFFHPISKNTFSWITKFGFSSQSGNKMIFLWKCFMIKIFHFSICFTFWAINSILIGIVETYCSQILFFRPCAKQFRNSIKAVFWSTPVVFKGAKSSPCGRFYVLRRRFCDLRDLGAIYAGQNVLKFWSDSKNKNCMYHFRTNNLIHFRLHDL